MESVVVRDPAIMSGEPTFRGTRVLVRTLFDYLEAGHSMERFLLGFPTVTREMALKALEEAKESIGSVESQPTRMRPKAQPPSWSRAGRALHLANTITN
jgi:uncharacterized protein (DUF433 family)